MWREGGGGLDVDVYKEVVPEDKMSFSMVENIA
jgi:hypothetical protein